MSTLRKLPTTILGTGYELHCLRLLNEQLRMSLDRIGGKGDGGIDLQGWWNLPHTNPSMTAPDANPPQRIRVLAQCKAEKTRPGPRLIREMEGVARREHDFGFGRQQNRGTISGDPLETAIVALLCSRSGFSPAAVIEANRSRIPTLLLHIPFDYEAQLISRHQPIMHAVDHELLDSLPRRLRGAFWNAALMGTRGVLGNGWEIRKEFAHGVEDDFRIKIHRDGRPM
ncbi:hypothetical protein NliqN6_5270 [Naganishia liquefaciens]|uniref:Restriction endonuclease type IV Mrr domain-containing protein n=1 Tax=Naganishia liquefaciens TaxID=104408 RepID=A0A8H3YH11_9TREE|nr:hypothetical protein NliqN6_5270 [Naganishia liquefaciens]